MVLIFLLTVGLIQHLSGQEPKQGPFLLSLFGGSMGGVDFLTGFRGSDPGHPGTQFLYPEYDEAADGPLVSSLSAGVYGASLGYVFALSDTAVGGRYPLSWYFEASYMPIARFGDGLETRSWSGWDQTKLAFVDKTDSFAQTDRKAGMAGITTGALWFPFRSLPVGLDLGIGWARFTQSFTSGIIRALEGKADVSAVTANNVDTGLSASPGGRLERNHSALLLKAGLTCGILRFLSLDLSFRSASYFDKHDTNLYYIDSGETVVRTEGHRLGNYFTAGITVLF